jgi:hypothetical protein
MTPPPRREPARDRLVRRCLPDRLAGLGIVVLVVGDVRRVLRHDLSFPR